jgi:hypothetical protein
MMKILSSEVHIIDIVSISYGYEVNNSNLIRELK